MTTTQIVEYYTNFALLRIPLPFWRRICASIVRFLLFSLWIFLFSVYTSKLYENWITAKSKISRDIYRSTDLPEIDFPSFEKWRNCNEQDNRILLPSDVGPVRTARSPVDGIQSVLDVLHLGRQPTAVWRCTARHYIGFWTRAQRPWDRSDHRPYSVCLGGAAQIVSSFLASVGIAVHPFTGKKSKAATIDTSFS